MRCLQPSPDARFATTADLVHALERLTPDGHLRTESHDVVTVQAPRPRWQLAAAGAPDRRARRQPRAGCF